MSLRFWVLAAVYHTVVVAICLARGRAWLRRDAGSLSPLGFWRAGACDAAWLGFTAGLTAAILVPALPDPGFAFIRLASQTLFGEALLFLVFLAILHWRKRRVSRSALLTLSALGLLAIYVDAYHVEPEDLRIEEHDVILGDVESATRSIRLVHVSDIQTHAVRDYERRVVRTLAALDPDLVILTGDYVHMRLQPGRAETARRLAELVAREGPRPSLGTWAVGGDTDGPAIRARLREGGVRWLKDEVATVRLPGGRTLSLVGLSSPTSRGGRKSILGRLMAQLPPDSARIVFGHSPDFVLSLAGDPRVDLALAGHTHGGQVVIPLFGPPMTLSRVPRRVGAGGLHELGSFPVHVSRGVGLERGSAPQIRFLCPPEICVLRLGYAPGREP